MATKEDWLQLIEQEEGESFVLSLIQDIISRSQHVLFEKHIDVQVLPYAVGFARDTLLSLIDYKFFRRDPGNIDMDLWEPDEEPEPAVAESWARGAVPIRPLAPNAIRTEQSSSQKQHAQHAHDVAGPQQRLDSKESAARAAEPPKRTGISETSSANSLTQLNKIKSPNGRFLSPSKKPSSRTTKPLLNPGQHAPSRPPLAQPRPANNPAPSAPSRYLSATQTGVQPSSAHLPGSQPAGGGHHAPHTATHVRHGPEQVIQEENRRTMARVHNLQKDGGQAQLAYDFDGRIVLVNRVGPGKLMTQGVKARVVADDVQPVAAQPSTKPRKEMQDADREPGPANGHVSFKVGPLATATAAAAGSGAGAGAGSGPVPPDAKRGAAARAPPRRLPRPSEPDRPDRANGGGGGGANAVSGAGALAGTTIESALGVDGYVDDPALDVPALADFMKMAPGVTLKEGEAVRKGPVLPRKPVAKPDTKMPDGGGGGGGGVQTGGAPADGYGRSGYVVSKGQPQGDAALDHVLARSKPVLKPIAFPGALSGPVAGADHRPPANTSTAAIAQPAGPTDRL
ncbi:hypothetical protein BC831DRAFT_449537 [Entophlyctis helioformis]|nr:hypothetical protein BC831DRAFT_449537 [Entophlyctis helioformis]